MCNHLMMQDMVRFVSVLKAVVLPVFTRYLSIHLFFSRMLRSGKTYPPSFLKKSAIQVVLFYS